MPGLHVIVRLAAALTLAFPACALAQYPQKPVRLIVPFAPAGPPDILARLVGQKLGEQMRQAVVVENRVGAGGIIGAGEVAKAPADGYTLMFASPASMLISPVIYPNVQYDPIASFTPVSLVGTTTFVLVVNPKVPARTLRDFIDLAKAQPGRLNYGSSTQGTPPHILAEMFKQQAGVDVFGINYKGSADSITALLAGDVQMVVDQFAAVLPLISSGRVRALVVTSEKRVKSLPDVPSAAQAGLPGFAVDSWFGIVGPRGLAAEVVRRLSEETNRAIATKELAAGLERQGLAPASSTPEQFAAVIRNDAPRWASAIRAANVKVQ